MRRNHTKLHLWGMLVLFCFSPVLAQTTRYVEKALHCRNLQPCHRTIGEAVAAAGMGDTIRVFPGEYEESVNFDPGKNNLTLEAFFAHRMPLISAPTGGNSAIVIRASHVTIRHMRLEADGIVVFMPTMASRTGIVIEENHINGLPRPNPDVASTGVWAGNIADLTVRGNQIRNVAGDGIWLQGGVSNFTRNSVIEGNYIFKVGGIGVFVGGRLNEIKENFILSAGGTGILVSGENADHNLLEANRVIGSEGYGIACMRVPGTGTGANRIRFNTALANEECDLFDANEIPLNKWSDNKAHTRCGAPVDQP